MTVSQKMSECLVASKRALILGVGGGNDSVTALFLRAQLQRHFAFHPENLDIAAMLPDCLDYTGYRETGLPLVWEMTPTTERWVQGIRITGFPEPILTRSADRFGIGQVFGFDMSRGSRGIASALEALVRAQQYDLVLACDIGGDFIAAPENVEVLSPMMDGYALFALRHLQTSLPSLNLIGAVFGLGTDGESSPQMLDRALELLTYYHEGTFDTDIGQAEEKFYRDEVEPNRYSRTADFTLQEIRGTNVHRPIESYRVRYHSRPTAQRRRSYTGQFDHSFDAKFYGKYYLFDELNPIQNPFAIGCDNAVQWVSGITNDPLGIQRVHHEMVGQAVLWNGRSTLLSVPSRKFSQEDRLHIIDDTIASIENNVYDQALVYRADYESASLRKHGLSSINVNEHVLLIQQPDASDD